MRKDYTKSNLSQEISILVVDDERQIRSLFTRALQLIGYHVDAVASGEEALLLFPEKRYDVMILDLHMEGISGEAVMERAHELVPEMQIIILTGNPTLESAVKAIRAEVVEYLIKPARLQEIVATVNNALDKKRQRQHEIDNAISEAIDQVEISSQYDLILGSVNRPVQPVLLVSPLQLFRTEQVAKWITDLDTVLELTKGECEVLYWLMINHDHPVSCRQLVQLCWEYDLPTTEAQSIIRPYISRLRQKLEKTPHQPELIRTIRKRGYLFQSAD